MPVLRSALIYFTLVFGAGFALGLVRVPLLVPRLGVRTAELLEMPVMLAVIVLSARFIVRRVPLPFGARHLLGIGAIALSLLLTAELLGALFLQRLSFDAWLASRDPVSTSIYAMVLLLFATMPWIIARRTG